MTRTVSQSRAGDLDRHSFEASVEDNWAVMSRVARRLSAPGCFDDVVQDALVAAWRRRQSFTPELGTFRAWLLAITADHARRSWPRFKRVELADVSQEAMSDQIDGQLDVRSAVARLPERQRVAVHLFYYCDLPIAEVAVVMSCSEGTVKAALAAGRTRLAKTLDGEGDHA